jgi:hypothetical protein
MHEFKVRFSSQESVMDKIFLLALVQDYINVIGKVSHVVPIVSNVSVEVQGSQIERSIKGKLITGELKGCGLKSGVQHW